MSEYLDKLRTVGAIRHRSRSQVAEGRNPDTGERWKATTDEFNNTVTERSSGTTGVTDNQDVHLRPETVRQSLTLNGD